MISGSNWELNVTTCSFYIFKISSPYGNAFSTVGLWFDFSSISSSFLSYYYYGANDTIIYSPLDDSNIIYLWGTAGGSIYYISYSGSSIEIVSS